MFDIEDTDEFKHNFWKWFDNLSLNEKKRFWSYKSDMAKIFYYNSIYSKRSTNANSDNEGISS